MPWPFLLLSLVAFLASQASSLRHPPPRIWWVGDDQDGYAKLLDFEDPIEIDKRALTLLARLNPIRAALRQAESRHFDSRALRPRWAGNERPPGPLRFGR